MPPESFTYRVCALPAQCSTPLAALYKRLFAHSVLYDHKVKVKFCLKQAMKAQRGSRGIALLFL
jgi:hypothetical protein